MLWQWNITVNWALDSDIYIPNIMLGVVLMSIGIILKDNFNKVGINNVNMYDDSKKTVFFYSNWLLMVGKFLFHLNLTSLLCHVVDIMIYNLHAKSSSIYLKDALIISL